VPPLETCSTTRLEAARAGGGTLFTSYDAFVLEVIFGVLEAIAMAFLEPVVRFYRRLRIALHRWRASLY